MAATTDHVQHRQQLHHLHHLHQQSSDMLPDWAGNKFGLSCDKFGDMSWMPLDVSATNGGFAMDLGPDMYNMPLQPYDTMPFDTVIPTQISTNPLDDAASSIHSWPTSPVSTFSDVATSSTHTSPRDFGPESSFSSTSRRHSFQPLQNHGESSQTAGSQRRHSEIHVRGTHSPAAAAADTATEDTAPPTRAGNKKSKTIREKNRTAATKYRNKMKRSITELQETEQQLSEKNSILSAHVECLRNEILALKTEILRHGTCESKLIQEYIMKTAKQL